MNPWVYFLLILKNKLKILLKKFELADYHVLYLKYLNINIPNIEKLTIIKSFILYN